jgi:hypothetical protein
MELSDTVIVSGVLNDDTRANEKIKNVKMRINKEIKKPSTDASKNFKNCFIVFLRESSYNIIKKTQPYYKFNKYPVKP